MGIHFRWFKDYKIYDLDSHYSPTLQISYLGGGATSHSAGNVRRIQDLLKKYSEIQIPFINEDFIQGKDDINLVEPFLMKDACQKVLSNESSDINGLRERIEWFIKLSDDGYFISYFM